MKKCPNCGASLNPYMVRCEYCRSWIFDWDILLKDGEKCYISFVVNNFGENMALTALAIPHIETIEIKNESIEYSGLEDMYAHKMITNQSCEIGVSFTCVTDENGVLFRMEAKGSDR